LQSNKETPKDRVRRLTTDVFLITIAQSFQRALQRSPL